MQSTPEPALESASPFAGQRLTIIDVAKAAGVHPSTVSRALRNQPNLPQATRENIQAIADRMGYRPDPLVGALMQSRRLGRSSSHRANLGLLVCESKRDAWRPNAWMYNIHAGAAKQAQALGYSLDTFWLSEDQVNARTIDRILYARNIQGLILPPEHEAMLPFNLDWQNYAIVSLHNGESRTTPRFHQVVSNHFHSLLGICRKCESLGYRRVGLVLRDHPETHYEYGRLVLGGYYAGSLPNNQPPLILRELSVPAIARWVRENKIDAIIQAGGGLTHEFGPLELMAALESAGIKVGVNVGYVHMCHLPKYGMATVDERIPTLGETAARLLIEMIQRNQRGIPVDPMVHTVDAVFHDGQTLPLRAALAS